MKGEIRVNSFCNPVENILNYKKFYLKDGSGIQIDFLNSSHPYIAKIKNINSIEEAKNLINEEIFISEREMRKDDGAIYWNDLLGCEVINDSEILLGIVYKVDNHGASDLIFIKTDSEDIIIPLEDIFLIDFDKHNNILRVDWDI